MITNGEFQRFSSIVSVTLLPTLRNGEAPWNDNNLFNSSFIILHYWVMPVPNLSPTSWGSVRPNIESFK